MTAMGELELQLLFALVELSDASPGRAAHGIAIADLLERETGRAPSSGAIHTTLERLGRRGFVSSWLGEPTPVRGGRRKRFYSITPRGARALKASYHRLTSIARGRTARLDEIARGET